ncbi:MAG TPA: hypothetical protein DEA90_09160 [Opitutae bacterium]|nr:hypothetical protein [Puniceicoccaceae bacterium]HBR94317.1 hypothetical protein [Opitutae bacterium]|tara:strand:- start:2615 stop:2878 length:264 start_codon:yes stop_codon:yes gene_type:complete
MKHANHTSPTAQRKALRTIGPNGIARQYIHSDATEAEIEAGKGRIYEVCEWKGIGIYEVHGRSNKSLRQAFEAAGIYDTNPPRGTRV